MSDIDDLLLQYDADMLLAVGSLGKDIDRSDERRTKAAQRVVERHIADIYLDHLPDDHGTVDGTKSWFETVTADSRLRVNVHCHELTDALRAAHHLQAASGVQSAVAVTSRLGGGTRFHWPLRIGVPAEETAVLDAVLDWGYHSTLANVRSPLGPGQSADVVFVTSTDIEPLLDVQIGLLIVLLQADEFHPAVVAQLADHVDASAISVFLGEPHEVITWFLDELAHDQAPDRALARVAHEWDRPYAIAAAPDYLSQSRLSSVSARTRADLATAVTDHEINESTFTIAMEQMQVLSPEGGMFYGAESDGASTTAHTLDAVDSVLVATGTQLGTSTTSSQRRLQAQVFATEPVRLQRHYAFAAGAKHEIDVRIGLSEADWIALAAPFPDAHPPADGNDILRVNLVVGTDLYAKDILLPEFGESTLARFEVDVPDDVEHFEATIVVWRGLTQLQTAVLSGPVGTHDQHGAGASLTLSSGDVAAVDLDLRQDPDLSFRRLQDQIVIAQHGKEESVPTGPLDASAGLIRSRLFDIAVMQDQLGVGLSDEDVVALIRGLAINGAYLRRQLFGDQDRLDQVHHVEVTTNSSADFFPVEFFYDYGTPADDAELCTAFADATGPECPNCCAIDDTAFVCPSGFWALNRLIERQVRTARMADSASNTLAPEPTSTGSLITTSGNVVFAASDKVNETDAHRVKSTVAELRSIVGVDERVHPVGTWDEWADAVGANAPALLAALAHSVPTAPDLPALQIAADQDLRIDNIRPLHLTGPDTPAPLLLLFACNGANPDDHFKDFVRVMRMEGAAVVIASLTFVLGQHAAPAAVEFVRAIWNVEPQPIGEMMRHVRADMLRNDNPLALALVAYGSADWQFAGKGTN